MSKMQGRLGKIRDGVKCQRWAISSKEMQENDDYVQE